MLYKKIINNIKVTNCALAAIYDFIKYKTAIVTRNDKILFLVSLEFEIKIQIPNIAANIHVEIYIASHPPNSNILYIPKS